MGKIEFTTEEELLATFCKLDTHSIIVLGQLVTNDAIKKNAPPVKNMVTQRTHRRDCQTGEQRRGISGVFGA